MLKPVIRRLQSCPSTMDEAKKLATAGAPDGSAVRADEQTAGRGRRERTWHSPAGGGLWLSVLATPRPQDHGLAVLAAALAVCESVDPLLLSPLPPPGGEGQGEGGTTGIRWPNDVVIRGKKLAGIIGEAHEGRLVIGIGVNTNIRMDQMPEEIRPLATSLLEETGRETDHEALFAAILAALAPRLEQLAAAKTALLVADVKKRSVVLGTQVEVTRGAETIRGTAEDISPAGDLLLRDGEKLYSLSSGEITRLSL